MSVERVMQKCPQCQQVTDGFLIPDGRFVCPTCFPPPVYERWQREWEPIEKQRLTVKTVEQVGNIVNSRDLQANLGQNQPQILSKSCRKIGTASVTHSLSNTSNKLAG